MLIIARRLTKASDILTSIITLKLFLKTFDSDKFFFFFFNKACYRKKFIEYNISIEKTIFFLIWKILKEWLFNIKIKISMELLLSFTFKQD